jgi:hypothetical protein
MCAAVLVVAAEETPHTDGFRARIQPEKLSSSSSTSYELQIGKKRIVIDDREFN